MPASIKSCAWVSLFLSTSVSLKPLAWQAFCSCHNLLNILLWEVIIRAECQFIPHMQKSITGLWNAAQYEMFLWLDFHSLTSWMSQNDKAQLNLWVIGAKDKTKPYMTTCSLAVHMLQTIGIHIKSQPQSNYRLGLQCSKCTRLCICWEMNCWLNGKWDMGKHKFSWPQIRK